MLCSLRIVCEWVRVGEHACACAYVQVGDGERAQKAVLCKEMCWAVVSIIIPIIGACTGP
jgi:hypothetical protein